MIINEVLTDPYITGAIGYVVGQGAEQLALRNIDQNRSAMIGAHEGAELGRRQSKLHRAAAQLAILGAVAGFAFGHVAENGETHTLAPPELTVVADHSFDTNLNGSADRVNTIAAGFANTDQLRVQGLVAHNGGSDPVKLDKLAKDQPYGPPSLDSTLPVAIGEAYNNSQPAESNALGTSESRNAGVLVITDGNPVGSEATVVKHAHEDGNLPVFVADVAKHEDKQTVTELRAIAQKTGGKYWNARTNTPAVAEAVKQEIKPRETTEKSATDKLAWLLVGLATSGGAVLQFFRRKNETAIS